MKLFKKIAVAFLSVMCLAASALGFAACATESEKQSETTVIRDKEIVAVYNMYVANALETGEKVLNYDEWLEYIKGEKGEDGAAGKSAYELAVENGFNGTVEEWLVYIKGEDGAAGKSAYELAVENGFVGTESEWLESLGNNLNHSHIYDATQTGYICDPEGYVIFSCECGESYRVNNYQPHVYVNTACIYCGQRNTVTLEGYTYMTSFSQEDEEYEIVGGVTVILINGGGVSATTISNSDGYYSFTDLPKGEYTVRFSLQGYVNITVDVLLDSNFEQNIYLDYSQSSSLLGTVYVADSDLDYSNNVVLPGAKIIIEKVSGTNSYTAEYVTNANGAYKFENLPAGKYKLTVEKEGYVVIEYYISIDINVEVLTNINLEAVPESGNATSGVASGLVYDASRQGEVGVEGLDLSVRKGNNNLTGEVVLQLKSGTNGSYRIEGLVSGNYTVYVEDNRILDDESLRFADSYFNIKIIAGVTIPNQNGSVSGGVFSGQIRIVLEWGSTPKDLDSHLTGPNLKGDRFHIYFSSKTYGDYANLDRDDMDSYGPETTTIVNFIDGVYRFSVHDFSNKSSSSSRSLANSGATVKVYFGDELAYTFYVPDKAGTLWTVFEYDSARGILTPINSMGYQSNVENIT